MPEASASTADSTQRSPVRGIHPAHAIGNIRALLMTARLSARPISLVEANKYVSRWHRHHPPVRGHKFSIGAVAGGQLVGVAIVGRPVARMRDDGETLEVTRLCTDGTRNACSFLYGRAARAAFAMGYRRIGTYVLASEGGASLRASGWRVVAEVRGRSWSCPSRLRADRHPLEDKTLWELRP
jgi:hypothetical protein